MNRKLTEAMYNAETWLDQIDLFAGADLDQEVGNDACIATYKLSRLMREAKRDARRMDDEDVRLDAFIEYWNRVIPPAADCCEYLSNREMEDFVDSLETVFKELFPIEEDRYIANKPTFTSGGEECLVELIFKYEPVLKTLSDLLKTARFDYDQSKWKIPYCEQRDEYERRNYLYESQKAMVRPFVGLEARNEKLRTQDAWRAWQHHVLDTLRL